MCVVMAGLFLVRGNFSNSKLEELKMFPVMQAQHDDFLKRDYLFFVPSQQETACDAIQKKFNHSVPRGFT